MKMRLALLAIGMAFALAGCMDVDLDPFGDDTPEIVPAANGCTSQGCPQAPQFCIARGYKPDTDSYRRCIISVEDSLRKDNR
jgi:hypothetical protein